MHEPQDAAQNQESGEGHQSRADHASGERRDVAGMNRGAAQPYEPGVALVAPEQISADRLEDVFHPAAAAGPVQPRGAALNAMSLIHRELPSPAFRTDLD
jgi:hypothetical protein